MSTPLSRRNFLSRSAALAAAGATVGCGTTTRPADAMDQVEHIDGSIFASTWAFGRFANEEAQRTLASGSLLDAIEGGIRLVEADAENHSVGLGGTPNAGGVVELDACIMDGTTYNAGSVGGMTGIAHPISVARRVMEKTKHVMLVGEGARQFAIDEGLEAVDLLTEDRRQKWEEWKKEQVEMSLQESHDTIALIGRAADGTLAGGCSTSGWGYKLPGRVGDSPIIGGGLYVDGKVGAAGATGVGENVMRYCGTFLTVELMARGATPEEACIETVESIGRKDPMSLADVHVNFVAIDRHGRYGGAGSDKGFAYSITIDGQSEVIEAIHVTN
ncbi:MAG: N(4)-(beta-N-acetylglucosaminyl)-L-asparaginase [Gemmatimonadetes bacterium]|jgi:N4-(beta-N-acetylglucosaminyl)-L-asparaginase|nr:N(4)-(beta-N-acetylglucosaminyl)-L-asparaginase [Gemmatimonadota bacterium]MBT6147497.1 N(4)-(beta-N-acetylglucosaminyl)-L-asparaginase [Gemmatimonadota bacterium]MBT7861841.1 N(4)-(beta-N-acetylglucosaminyl)-L-asparaginase [Gemmatimonadota bacterium]